jgi:uncharacterized membrane protein YfcA
MILRCTRVVPKYARAALVNSRSGRAQHLKAVTFRSSSSASLPKKEMCLLGLLGTFSGCIGPLVGVGGGIISIPVWREFTVLPQKVLSATSLVAVGVSACAASMAFIQAGRVDFAAAGDFACVFHPFPAAQSRMGRAFSFLICLLMLFAAAMSISSAYFAIKGAKYASKVSDKFLQRCLGCFMLVSVPFVIAKTAWWRATVAQSSASSQQISSQDDSASAMNRVAASFQMRLLSLHQLFNARLPLASAAIQRVSETVEHLQTGAIDILTACRSKWETKFPEASAAAASLLSAAGLSEPDSKKCALLYLLVGAAAGGVSGMLGVGGGVVITPALAAFSSMPHLTILGTVMMTMVPAAVSGTLQHVAARNVLWPQAAALAAGSMVGATAGSHVALMVPEDSLRVMFAVMMSVFGARTLLR